MERFAKHAEDYRIEYNTIRPHEAIAWNRPQEVHLGLADPRIPTVAAVAGAASLYVRIQLLRYRQGRR